MRERADIFLSALIFKFFRENAFQTIDNKKRYDYNNRG